jgi:hypothetical protein
MLLHACHCLCDSHGLFSQVVAHLGLTMPDVKAKVNCQEGEGFRSVNNCIKAGSCPAGSTVCTGKRATPEPAGGIELQVWCRTALLLAAISPCPVLQSYNACLVAVMQLCWAALTPCMLLKSMSPCLPGIVAADALW